LGAGALPQKKNNLCDFTIYRVCFEPTWKENESLETSIKGN
jgi:hypothetical protein